LIRSYNLKSEKGGFMKRTGWPETVSAFLVGIGVGAAIGILFAPQSGEDTRDYLVGTAQAKLDEAVSTGQKWVNRAKRNVDDATDYVKDAADAGQRAYRDAAKSATA
jgi:gas vesicle protein